MKKTLGEKNGERDRNLTAGPPGFLHLFFGKPENRKEPSDTI
jgi:hypothetical protein